MKMPSDIVLQKELETLVANGLNHRASCRRLRALLRRLHALESRSRPTLSGKLRGGFSERLRTIIERTEKAYSKAFAEQNRKYKEKALVELEQKRKRLTAELDKIEGEAVYIKKGWFKAKLPFLAAASLGAMNEISILER